MTPNSMNLRRWWADLRATQRGTLLVAADVIPPMSYILKHYSARGEPLRTTLWGETGAGGRRYAKTLKVHVPKDPRKYPFTVTLISPAVFLQIWKAPEDVVLVHELGLTALFAVASKIRRRRAVISLTEGSLDHVDSSPVARIKMLYRRRIARFVDAFLANGAAAREYLENQLHVPSDKIREGWWLAGLESDNEDDLPPVDEDPNEEPVFLSAGQLIPRKGMDLLIRAVARYHRDVGPCHLQIAGSGPERDKLMQLAAELGIDDHVAFLGRVDHERLEGLLRQCDLFVFASLSDLVGRVVVEALSVGTPVAVSCVSGAARSVVQEGVNGVLFDPRNDEDFARALQIASSPAMRKTLREGARASSKMLTPAAASDHLYAAVVEARRSLSRT